jgi:hypothetical protein
MVPQRVVKKAHIAVNLAVLGHHPKSIYDYV